MTLHLCTTVPSKKLFVAKLCPLVAADAFTASLGSPPFSRNQSSKNWIEYGSKELKFIMIVITVIGELVVQHHPAVGQGGAAVAERHLDAVVDLSTRHVGGDGKHVDG